MLPSYRQASVVSFWLTYVSLFFLLPFLLGGLRASLSTGQVIGPSFLILLVTHFPKGIHRLIKMEQQFNLAISLRLPLKIYLLVSGFP